MEKFEYKEKIIEMHSNLELEKELNKLGSERWELIWMNVVKANTINKSFAHIILKRTV